MESRKRIFFPELERLRAIACIMVFFTHFTNTAPFSFLINTFPSIFHSGWGGLHLFFTISGFVITYTFFDSLDRIQGETFLERIINARTIFKQFLIRRAFRLLPLAALTIIIAFFSFAWAYSVGVIEPQANWMRTFLRTLIDYPFLVYNDALALYDHTEDIHRGALGPHWSLAVEGQFYFIWPLLFLAFNTNSKRAAFCLAIASLALFIIRPAANFYFDHTTAYYNTFTNIDSLFLGSFLAFLYIKTPLKKPTERKLMRNIFALTLLFVVWTFPTLGNTAYSQVYNYAPIVLSSAILVWLAVQNAGFVLELPGLKKILLAFGKRSYAFYVLQLILGRIVTWVILDTGLFEENGKQNANYEAGRFIIFLIVLLITVEIAHRFIEVPLRNYGRKLASRVI